MKILTFNIRQGGTKHHESIVAWLQQQSSADILVLTEFRENTTGQKLKRELQQAGWSHIASSNPPAKINGVLIASNLRFTALPHPEEVPEGHARFLECNFEAFKLIGVYFPNGQPKQKYWEWFLPHAEARAKSPCLLVGDFNTGKHYIDEAQATFRNAHYMEKMESIGYTDAWRNLHGQEREYTWFSAKGNGFRLDYVFASAPLVAQLESALHLHSPRKEGISDHSALQVTFGF